MRSALNFSLPLLALALLAPGARADFAAPGTLDGDPRLAVRRTIQIHDQSVQDILADLNLQTGVRFFANPGMSGIRATVYARQRPLHETLRAVATLLHGHWRRDGTGPDYGYTLEFSPTYTAEAERKRTEGLRVAADTIVEEAATFNRLELLSPVKLYETSAGAARELATAVDPARVRTLAIIHGVCEQLLRDSEPRSFIYHLLKDMPADQVEDMMRGKPVEYGWPSAVGILPLPAALAAQLQESSATEGLALVPGMGGASAVRVRFWGEQRRDWALRWQLIIAKPQLNSMRTARYAGHLPSAALPAQAPRGRGESPQEWSADPILSAPVSFSVAAEIVQGRMAGIVQRRTLGEALAALEAAHPLDVVADGFYSGRLTGFSQTDRPVGEALTRLCLLTGHDWTREDGFVLLRSAQFDADRRMEPPSDLVGRWTARARTAPLDLDDYAEIAALPDGQLSTLMDMYLHGDFPATLDPVSNAREHLRLWNRLSRAQRKRAAETGIAYTELNPAQQDLFRSALTDTLTASYRLLVPATLPKLRIRLEMHVNRMWGIRANGAASFSGMNSKEEALAALHRIDPKVKIDDLQSVVFTTAGFCFETTSGEPYGRTYASLPTRWEKPEREREP